MLTERGELHVRKGMILMNRLPPIEVSCISDGGKLFRYQLGPATNRTAEKAPRSYRFYLSFVFIQTYM